MYIEKIKNLASFTVQRYQELENMSKTVLLL